MCGNFSHHHRDPISFQKQVVDQTAGAGAMIFTVTLILISEIWNTAGQVLFKKSTNALDFTHEGGIKSYARFLRQVIRQREIVLGLLSMAGGLVFWLAALSKAELSVVFPLGSMQYILILFASRLFLSEKSDRMRILGTGLIAAGIALITFGEV